MARVSQDSSPFSRAAPPPRGCPCRGGSPRVLVGPWSPAEPPASLPQASVQALWPWPPLPGCVHPPLHPPSAHLRRASPAPRVPRSGPTRPLPFPPDTPENDLSGWLTTGPFSHPRRGRDTAPGSSAGTGTVHSTVWWVSCTPACLPGQGPQRPSGGEHWPSVPSRNPRTARGDGVAGPVMGRAVPPPGGPHVSHHVGGTWPPPGAQGPRAALRERLLLPGHWVEGVGQRAAEM